MSEQKARYLGPVWIVAPGDGLAPDFAPRPEHPIVLPPDVPEEPSEGHPEHPIYIQVPVDPNYDIGIEQPDRELPGDQPRPDQSLPGDQPKPDQSLPGDQPEVDNELPGDQPKPDQSLPGDQPKPDQGLPGDQPVIDVGFPADQPVVDNSLPGEQPKPTHPIYIAPYPDRELPEGASEVGEIEFYQRKTIGLNWNPELLKPNQVVGIYVIEGDDASLVRTVANTGASSVTFPQSFTGKRTFRVSGVDGYVEGDVTVK